MSDGGRSRPASLPTDGQYLAVPLGTFIPRHRRLPAVLAWWYRRQASALTLVGLLAAGAALAVAALPKPLDVFRDQQGIHMGSMTLYQEPQPSPGLDLFVGPATIVEPVDKTHHDASGITVFHGQRAIGTCSEQPHIVDAPEVATCKFTIGTSVLLARDVFDNRTHAWLRTYSDGVRASFNVPASTTAVMVPVPLGR